MGSITLETGAGTEFIDITDRVEEAVREAGVQEGMAHIFTRHTTAAVFVNENEAGLLEDYRGLMERLVPRGAGYKHDRIDDNAHAHLRAVLLGPGKTVPVSGSRLQLGQWQRVFFAEFDGPRRRECVVHVVPLRATE